MESRSGSDEMKPSFSAGKNIAIKVPEHEFMATVTFYKDVLGFEQLSEGGVSGSNVTFRFGDMRLWIDKADGLSQAEIWLEINTDDSQAAAEYMLRQGCSLRAGIEPLAESTNAFWVSSPSNIIHLINEDETW